MPDAEKPALEKVAAGLGVEGKSRDEVLQTVQKYFQDRIHYRIWQEPARFRKSDDTPLGRFLLTTHSGHCEHSATATVLLLREFHIQTRYAVGYAVEEGSRNGYVVRQRDAHAWCLAWNDRTRTWEDFDTTPASWVAMESSRMSPWQRLMDAWSWTEFEFARFRWGERVRSGSTCRSSCAVLGFLLYRILFRRGRKRARLATAGPPELFHWPGRDSEFYLVERRLAQDGVIPRDPDETLSHWLRRAAVSPALETSTAPWERCCNFTTGTDSIRTALRPTIARS